MRQAIAHANDKTRYLSLVERLAGGRGYDTRDGLPQTRKNVLSVRFE